MRSYYPVDVRSHVGIVVQSLGRVVRRRAVAPLVWRNGLAFAIAAAACNDTPVEPRAPSGTILYGAYSAGKSDIVASDPGATTPRRLTTSGQAYEPKWSQDGQWIVYLGVVNDTVLQRGTNQVFVMRADGSGARQVTTDTGRVETPSISRDGSRVAYACGNRGPPYAFHLCVRPVDGAVSTVIAPSTLAFDPAWSPDGSLIAFVCDAPGATVAKICTIAPDGSGLRALSADSLNVSSVTWSPDGSRIAFSATPPQSQVLTLYIMLVDGGQVRTLFNETPAVVYRDTPTWSADGTQLAFVRYLQDGAKVYVAKVDGTGEHALVTDGTFQLDPSWSPTASSGGR